MTENTKKHAYIAPNLSKVGRVESVTAGTTSGKNTDSYFPVGTPYGDVTFS